MLATILPSELHEVTEKLLCEVLPAGERPYGDHMHIPNRLSLRDKAKQVSDDLGSPMNEEGRVSKLMNQEWMVKVAGISIVPEFMQLIENLIVVLLGTSPKFLLECSSTFHWSARLLGLVKRLGSRLSLK
jgi:hypothetical protein